MSILNMIGSQNCRIFTKDVVYHAWPNVAMKRGVTCVCGAIRVKRVHRNGEYESEAVPVQPDTYNVSHRLDSAEEQAALEQFRPMP